jgi:excisionase family DNA binding protein
VTARAPSDAIAWPPLLVTARALAYTGVSRSTLYRAVRRGELAIYGRAGGRGARVFRREDLDRWLAGPAHEPPAPNASARKPARRAAPAAPPADVHAALARIRTIARGG